MRPRHTLALSIAALATTALTAFAEPVLYKIDGGHSQVGFSIRHFFSRVSGRFTSFEGTVLYDEKTPGSSSANITIKTASIWTNNERRDNDLRSAHFFEADSFSTITFKSTKVTPGAEGKLKIEGALTMHGVTRPVTLDAAFLGAGDTGIMGRRAGWSATTTINRKDFGILWNQVLDQGGTMLGDEVAIQIDIEGVYRAPAPGN